LSPESEVLSLPSWRPGSDTPPVARYPAPPERSEAPAQRSEAEAAPPAASTFYARALSYNALKFQFPVGS